MENQPIISVIMPVYNVGNYVGRAIESIQNQNVKNIEIICVDDCSTDCSCDVLRKYAENDERIKLYRNKENIGAGANKNKALNVAQGEYICFCDADDYLSEGMFISFVEYIYSFELDGIMYGSNFWSGKECNPCRFTTGLKDRGIYRPNEILKYNIFEKNFFTSAARVLLKKTYLKKVQAKFTEGTICDDLQYTLKIMLNSDGRFMYVKKHFYNYCKRDGSISSSMMYGRFLCEIIDIIFDYIRCNGNIPMFVQEILYGTLSDLYISISFENKSIFSKYVNNKYGTKVLSEILSSQTSQYFRNMDNIISLVRNKRNDIYVYGAGNYAVDLYRVLKAYGICVSGFVVSVLNGNVDSIDGIKVYEIADIADNLKKCLVLVATISKHHDKIVKILNEYRIRNVVLCT